MVLDHDDPVRSRSRLLRRIRLRDRVVAKTPKQQERENAKRRLKRAAERLEKQKADLEGYVRTGRGWVRVMNENEDELEQLGSDAFLFDEET